MNFEDWIIENEPKMQMLFMEDHPEILDDDLADLWKNRDYQDLCEDSYQEWCTEYGVKPEW